MKELIYKGLFTDAGFDEVLKKGGAPSAFDQNFGPSYYKDLAIWYAANAVSPARPLASGRCVFKGPDQIQLRNDVAKIYSDIMGEDP